MPVKRLLDDRPSTWHFEKCEQVRHAHTGTGQIARPSCDFKTNDRNRFEDVHANHTGLDAGSWAILVYPVEEEPGPDGELFPGVAEE